VTDELRALLRADLEAERPPPIGDIVGAAIREGRRRRRYRRMGMVGAGAVVAGALVAVLVSGLGLVARPQAVVPAADVRSPAASPAAASASAPVATRPPLIMSPETVPIPPTVPTALPRARTLTIHSGTQRAEGMQKKATSAAMLHLLTQLLPPGRTSHFGAASDNDLHVQLYLDRGDGPGMVRVVVDRSAPGERQKSLPGRPHGGTGTVTIDNFPDNCLQNTVVAAEWADGTVVQVDVATCLAWDGTSNPPAQPVLTADEAVRIAADPRWGVTMAAAEVDVAGKRFPAVPVFSS
jgi:hypothetical protein